MTYSNLALEFIDSSMTGFPHSPRTRIYINSYGEDKGRMFITQSCVSLSELEYQIERLHKELEKIRREANKKYTSFSKARSNRRSGEER